MQTLTQRPKITPINGWTKQSMIEKVMEKVPENGCRNSNGACVYRLPDQPNGPGCAIGAFLSDELASKLPNIAIVGLLHYPSPDANSLVKELPFLNRDLLSEYQHEHDRVYTGTREAVIKWIEANIAD